MKAIVFTKYGLPEVLKLREVKKPSPKENEVLVKILTTAINDWDWCYVRGKPLMLRLIYGLTKPNIQILGAEIAGQVESVGSAVKKFQPGDNVYGDISESGFGGFAEFVCVTEDALIRKPESMTFQQAAALSHAAMLAYQGLVEKGGIREGQKILINGAGGGAGTFGLQIAKQFGAEVTGVDSSDKLDMMRSLGFDHVIDYRQEDFTKSGIHYDLILDTKTNRSPFTYTKALNPTGTYVTVGGHLERIMQIMLLGPLISIFNKKHLCILALKPNKDFAYMNDLFEAGKLKFELDESYSLNKIPEALQYFGDGKHKGKVVVNVQE